MKQLLGILLLTSTLWAGGLTSYSYETVKGEIGRGAMVLLEVGATSCRACKEMGVLLDTAMQEKPERKIFFVDVGKHREDAKTLGVQLIPTQILYDGAGHEIARHIGGFSAQGLASFFAKYGF